ncbi:glycoside hydrolase family 13 protein [Aquabacterium sp. OR-4]|uniref:glycoside hydrolase family 13 protein n=1 Tax=Aquabacterium sp. OR-4 TaxID=2978127 RepID=UPI0021B33A67|nr:glycoside hydrolase family 13 protein [Aquabacterium sp. OR-4]MDT7834210.1 glycoside hydrolase family 13 protein [Aquabacterium sp. OR-4]
MSAALRRALTPASWRPLLLPLLLAAAGSATAAEPAPAPSTANIASTAANAANAPNAATTPAAPGSPPAGCQPDPLAGRTLYLRGSLNGWTADERQRLPWACDRHELVLPLEGEQRFKLGDEAWSADADFGQPAGPGGAAMPPASGPLTLAARGRELQRHFAGGLHRLVLRWPVAGGPPQLQIDDCQALMPGQPRCQLTELRAAEVSDPVARSLRYDSRALAHKQPFGAVPAGQRVRFAVAAAAGVDSLTLVLEQRTLEGDQSVLRYTALARVPMQRTRLGAGREQFSATWQFNAVGVQGYWFEARIGGQTWVLHNNAEPLAWTREKGVGGLATVAAMPAAGPASPTAIRRYRLSVYQPGFRVPAWAQQAVYYYVFPERFRNGDRRNDPQPGTRRYHQHHQIEAQARWIGTPYRPGSGDGSDSFYNNDFFGGDIAGLIDKLPHLQRLGITAIYSTPLFLAASNHKYDTADYHRIDPGFGSNADFERLTASAARLGLRFIPDASLNHTGSDSVYFDRFGNHAGSGPSAGAPVGAFAGGRPNPASPYASWYRFDTSQSEPDKQYQGWVGVTDLPELDKNAPAWRHFAYRAPDSVTRHWLQRGAAGWRMDVAPWVPDDFWREWRGVVKATRPDALTIAETWFDPAKHLLGDMFDSTMNYIFRNAVLDWAAGGSAQAMAAQLEHLREQVPPPAFHALMNLLSSHDQPRASWVLGDKGATTPAPQRALARQRLRLAMLLQLSYPGAPAIYYGDEVGLGGGEDPYNRAPYPWADEGGQPDTVLEDEVRRLIALRKAHPVLSRGTLLAPLHVDEQALVLARRLAPGPGTGGGTGQAAAPARWAITGYSNADGPRSLRVALPAGLPADTRFADLLGGPALQARQGWLQLQLPARHGVLLVPAPTPRAPRQ